MADKMIAQTGFGADVDRSSGVEPLAYCNCDCPCTNCPATSGTQKTTPHNQNQKVW
jgi:hypothetical protein